MPGLATYFIQFADFAVQFFNKRTIKVCVSCFLTVSRKKMSFYGQTWIVGGDLWTLFGSLCYGFLGVAEGRLQLLTEVVSEMLENAVLVKFRLPLEGRTGAKHTVVKLGSPLWIDALQTLK